MSDWVARGWSDVLPAPFRIPVPAGAGRAIGAQACSASADDAARLVVVESALGGIDTVESTATITLAAYGYWLREKGWDPPAFMRVMRIDNTMAYVITGVFVLEPPP